MPAADSPTRSACDALEALRAAAAPAPIAALISGGQGQWASRSLVASLGERIAVDNAADLPEFFSRIKTAPSPASSGWIGCLNYELGALLEPTSGPPRATAPFAELWRATAPPAPTREAGAYDVAPLRSAGGQSAYLNAVERALEYIRAGDIYQVNLTHPLEASVTGDTRALAADVIQRTAAWFGAYIETPTRTIISASPELLVRVTPDRRIIARPIKGTRQLGAEDALRRSEKDAAELAMIVDLMRNDLGRVCALASVQVNEPRTLEPHAGVVHTTATISGRLHDDASREDILRAVFPAGSITGAPKIRAMQIINELEDQPRGVYCGSIAWLGDDGSMDLSVAIRTAQIESGTLRFGIGAGIVAESEPHLEWCETLDKARGFAAAARTTIEDTP